MLARAPARATLARRFAASNPPATHGQAKCRWYGDTFYTLDKVFLQEKRHKKAGVCMVQNVVYVASAMPIAIPPPGEFFSVAAPHERNSPVVGMTKSSGPDDRRVFIFGDIFQAASRIEFFDYRCRTFGCAFG